MKKFIAIISAVIICIGNASFPVAAYEFDDSSILAIDAFDQQDESLEQWFMWLPMDVYGKRTYHDMLEDNFASTLHELLIPFDTGRIDGKERTALLNQYGFSELYNIYRLDEMQQTFNAAYNTNIDIASLDGLKMDGSHELIKIVDGYVFVQLSPHGTMANPNPSGGNRLGADSEYWRWYYADDWNPSDTIYTIVSNKNVAGYDIRTIDYIGYEPPSDAMLDSYGTTGEKTYDQTEKLRLFLNNDFENTPLKIQAADYETIEGDVKYQSSMQKINFYSFIDIDDDGKYELIISSTPETDNTYAPGCISVWDCDNDGNIICALAKMGHRARGSYKYHIISSDNQILLLEEENENNSAAYVNRMNLYRYNPNKYCFETETKVYYQTSHDLSFNPDEVFTINGVSQSRDDVKNYIDKIENNSTYLFSLFGENEELIQNNNDSVSVIINGDYINFDQPPMIVDGRTLVPMRKIFEIIGATISWDGTAQTVTSEYKGIIVKLTIGERKIYINNSAKKIDVPAQLINDTTYVPVRVIAEAFNCDVEWDGDAKTVLIDYKNQDLSELADEQTYNSEIIKRIKTEPINIFFYDYNNDGDKEAFVFYKKNGKNGIYCDFFSGDDYQRKSIFENKSFGELSFEVCQEDGLTVVEMTSDRKYAKLSYGFYVEDNEPQFVTVDGTTNSELNTNDTFNLDSPIYEYPEDDDRELNVKTEKLRYSTPKIDGFYWSLYLMEIKPEYLTTFRNGEDMYEKLITRKTDDKIQLLYSPDGKLYVNYKHYDSKNNRVELTYTKLKTDSNKLSISTSGKGNYRRGPILWPILFRLYAEESDPAREYECDTSDYFDDNSEWFENQPELNADLKIYFNGKLLELTKEIQTKNERTMYPLRECLELMGATVTWNGEKQEAEAKLGKNTLVFKIGSNKYWVNGEEKQMDVNAYVDDVTNSTYIPIRYAAEALGYTVNWIPGRVYNIISIGDNNIDDAIELKDKTETIKNASTAARTGKALYTYLEEKDFAGELERMNKASLNSMKAITDCDRAAKFNDCILDVADILVDGIITIGKTASGDIESGVDYINSSIIGMASKEFTNIVSPESTDELVRGMCNSAFDQNMKLTTELARYHYTLGKNMTDAQYAEYIKMYVKFMINNRTLKMGIEYFAEDLSNDFTTNLGKVLGTCILTQAKGLIKDAAGIGNNVNTIKDAFIYSSVEDFTGAMFKDFADAMSPALKSYKSDMDKMNKRYAEYLS